MSVFSLDFGRILEKSSLLCLECVLIPPFLSSLQTSRFVMIIVISRDNHHLLTGCPPLSALGQERFPIAAEEKSQERAGHLHLHCPQARASGTGCRGEAANLAERLQQPSLSPVSDRESRSFIITDDFLDSGTTITSPSSRRGAHSSTRTSTISSTSTTLRVTSGARASSSWRPAPPSRTRRSPRRFHPSFRSRRT